MNGRRILRVALVLNALALLVFPGLLAREYWLNYLWQEQTFGLASYMGTERALHDFRQGKLRIFKVADASDNDKFSGRSDGPFQIWIPAYFPSLGYPEVYATKQMVEAYNAKMRFMHQHPQQFITVTPMRKVKRTHPLAEEPMGSIH